ncbi:MAG: PAS domain-containing protein, partial [Desulfobulbaceae bacterium]|nr:PAS domain-containing protein [Desulfobulbaceae bacterium]
MMDSPKQTPDAKLVELLEKQKRELVVRVLKQHEEVQSEKVFSDKILANLSDLFFVMTENFVLVKSNEEFRRLLGFSREDFGRLHLDAFVANEASDRIKELAAAGEFKNFETEFTALGGEKIRVSLNGSTLITESGRILHMMIAKDMSDIHLMMSRIREAQEQLIHSGRLASLGEMAAGIGHELTQPLNAILLFARNTVKCLNG